MKTSEYKIPFLIYFSTFFCLVLTYGLICHFYLVKDASPIETRHYQSVQSKPLRQPSSDIEANSAAWHDIAHYLNHHCSWHLKAVQVFNLFNATLIGKFSQAFFH